MKPATQPVTPAMCVLKKLSAREWLELAAPDLFTDIGKDSWKHVIGLMDEFAEASLVAAAAPELLEALQDVTERLALSLQVFGNSPEVVNANVANARAAIRKATGAEGTRP